MWIAITCSAGLIFVLTIILGIVRQKVWLVMVAVVALFATTVAGYITFAQITATVVKTVTKTGAERTAEEVFAAEFDRPQTPCIQVVDYYDPSVSVLNDKLSICFSSCPAETRRILGRRRYDVAQRITTDVMAAMTERCCRNFVTPERFGSTVLECLASEGKDAYTMYISADSTRVYYTRQMK
ncbi:hypothetical protein [Nemorincola caseinilytica]